MGEFLAFETDHALLKARSGFWHSPTVQQSPLLRCSLHAILRVTSKNVRRTFFARTKAAEIGESSRHACERRALVVAQDACISTLLCVPPNPGHLVTFTLSAHQAAGQPGCWTSVHRYAGRPDGPATFAHPPLF